jgi:hypothetical protein
MKLTVLFLLNKCEGRGEILRKQVFVAFMQVKVINISGCCFQVLSDNSLFSVLLQRVFF